MERLICIENLHPDVDVFVLCRDFAKYGTILSASIDYDDQFTSLCKGQILFQKPSSAKAAARIKGVEAFGRKMIVRLASSKFNPGLTSKKYTKIFVKNFSLDWDECDLIKQFEKFGEVADVIIPKNEGKSNGYGSVIYKEHSCAKKAVEEMNDKVVAEKILKVEPYLPKELREELNANSLDYAKEMLDKSVQRNNLHVKNLPKNVNEIEFRKIFEEFGAVTSVKIARNEFKESRGFGFVAFKSEKDAEEARIRMNGYSYNSQILEVNFNQGKEQRQHYLQLLKSESEVTKPVKRPPRGKSVDSYSHVAKPIFSFSARRH